MVKTEEVLQIEVLLNMLNTLLSKAIYFKDTNLTNELQIIRHDVYYSDNFNYNSLLEKLKTIDKDLKKYE